MSSNDRYRGNREYRDLTVQTHYKESGRSPRVQTRGSMSDMKFSQNSVDARRPYEDQDLIYRTRYQAQPQQRQGQQVRAQQPRQGQVHAQQPYPNQAPQGDYYHAYGDYGSVQQPQRAARPVQQPQPQAQQYQSQQYQSQQFQQVPQPQRVSRPAPQKIKEPAEPQPVVDTSPKVSREQAMQIDMVFKICIMIWAAAALVTTIVLLTR